MVSRNYFRWTGVSRPWTVGGLVDPPRAWYVAGPPVGVTITSQEVRKEALSATLTPGEVSGGPTGYCGDNGAVSAGCKSSHDPYGTLTDTQFQIDATTYEVRSIRYGVSSSGNLFLTLDKELTTEHKRTLILHIGNARFRLADATSQSKGYQWTGFDGAVVRRH